MIQIKWSARGIVNVSGRDNTNIYCLLIIHGPAAEVEGYSFWDFFASRWCSHFVLLPHLKLTAALIVSHALKENINKTILKRSITFFKTLLFICILHLWFSSTSVKAQELNQVGNRENMLYLWIVRSTVEVVWLK